jgi:hypothetical protein
MLDEKEDRIRAEAYRRWEREGRPHGQHDRHWQEAADALETGEASDMIETEGTTQALTAPKAKSVAKPKAPKAAAAKVVAPKVVANEAKPAIAAPKRPRAKKGAAE